MSVKVYDTITPASATFPAVMAEHVNLIREDGTADSIQNLFNNKELGGGGDSSVTLTQEEFELLSDEEKFNGLYYTYDTKRIYKNGVQYGANEPIELTIDEYKALKEAGAIDEKQEYIITTNENGVLLEASDIGYNGATSGLSSLSVQGAIDEVNDKIDNIIDDENVNENTVLSSKKTMEEINGIISDTTSSETSTYSSAKIATILGGLQFGVDENGNYGYIKAGADTVTPFKSGVIELFTGTESFKIGTFTLSSPKALVTVTTGFKPKTVIAYLQISDPLTNTFAFKTEGTEAAMLLASGYKFIGNGINITFNDNGFDFQQAISSRSNGSVIYLAIS